MLVLLLLELLVHQDSMVAVTAVEAVVVLLFQVAMAVLVGTVESLEVAVAVAVWAKVLEQSAVLVVKVQEVRGEYGCFSRF